MAKLDTVVKFMVVIKETNIWQLLLLNNPGKRCWSGMTGSMRCRPTSALASDTGHSTTLGKSSFPWALLGSGTKISSYWKAILWLDDFWSIIISSRETRFSCILFIQHMLNACYLRQKLFFKCDTKSLPSRRWLSSRWEFAYLQINSVWLEPVAWLRFRFEHQPQ